MIFSKKGTVPLTLEQKLQKSIEATTPKAVCKTTGCYYPATGSGYCADCDLLLSDEEEAAVERRVGK